MAVESVVVWRPGSKLPKAGLKAQIVYAELERIKGDNGGLSPKAVVESARKKSSPLHRLFEWDDTKAAEQYRHAIARVVMSAISVVYEGGESSRAYYNIERNAKRVYVGVAEVLSDADLHRQVLAEAEAYYKSGQKRYSDILELGELHNAIERTFAKIKARPARLAAGAR